MKKKENGGFLPRPSFQPSILFLAERSLKDHTTEEEEQETEEDECDTCSDDRHVVGIDVRCLWKSGVVSRIPCGIWSRCGHCCFNSTSDNRQYHDVDKQHNKPCEGGDKQCHWR